MAVVSALAVALAMLATVATGAPVGTPSASSAVVEAPVPSTHSIAEPRAVEIAPGFTPAAGTSLVGELPSNTEMRVGIGLASRDPSGLVAWIATAQAPGTPEYGTRLSAASAAVRFGADPASVRSAEAYFGSYGLTTRSNPDGLILEVNGTSAEIGAAFGTTFDLYRLPDGRPVVDHPTAATLPPVAAWSGALGLGNLTAIRPAVVPSVPTARSAPSASCVGISGGLLPCAVQSAYDMNPLLANGTNGTGERVAVVDAYSSDETQADLTNDFQTFATDTGLPGGGISFLYPVPTSRSLNLTLTNPDWAEEDALDLEWARAAAPGDTVEMTFSPDPGIGLYEAVDWLVAHGAADVISMSWGEPDVGSFNPVVTPCSFACNASTDGSYAILGPVLELAAVEGISVFAAAGDCGSADGTAGVSTEFPASDPYVTAVGGTDLSLSGSYAWSSETGWSGNSSGAVGLGCQNGGGSGGGYSPFPRPAWQAGTGLPAQDVRRAIPDVAMDAQTYVAIIYGGYQTEVGGTSVGTPIWAGIAAVADQAAGTDLGLLGPSLYSILGSSRYATDFHDITSGNNGYSAGVGWDPVTGIGTPKVSALVPDLARGGAPAGGSLLIAVTASPQRGEPALSVTFQVTVQGGSGTYPLVGVSFGDGNASLTSTENVTHTFDQSGVYSAQAFVFDSGGNESVSVPVAIVVGGGAMLSVTLSASNSAPGVGTSLNLTTSVVGGVGPYTYNYSFGDGSFDENATGATVAHAYAQAGTFCAAVVVWDSADPRDGGASAPLAISAGGGAATNCTIEPPAFTLAPLKDLPVRDAPADFPALFNASGGTDEKGYPAPTLTLRSNDPYVAACNCALLRASGNYTVNATAVDSAGDHASANTTVTVAPALDAQFTATSLAGAVPLTVTLSVTASGGYRTNASDTVWTSGSGTTLTGASVQFTYPTAGEFLATGLLSDSGYGNASEAFLIDAEPVGGTPPIGLTGTIAPARDVGSGATVVLSAAPVGNGSASSSNAVVWTLGSGRSAYGPLVNETFLSTPALAGDTLDTTVAVEGTGEVPLIRVPLDLSSFFASESGGFVPAVDMLTLTEGTVTPTVGPVSLPVTGTAAAAGPGGATVGWQFGDGGSAEGASASYVYAIAGRYVAEATATDPYGDSAVLPTGVDVTVPIAIRGGPAPVSGPSPLSVAFTATATGGVGAPYRYAWSFGDGGAAAQADANHTYSSPGTYAVTVNVTDAAGEVGQARWNVTVQTAWGYPLVILFVGLGVGAAIAVIAVFLWDRRSRRKFTP